MARRHAELLAGAVMRTGLAGRVSPRSAQVLAADPAAVSRRTLQDLKSFNRVAGGFIAAK